MIHGHVVTAGLRLSSGDFLRSTWAVRNRVKRGSGRRQLPSVTRFFRSSIRLSLRVLRSFLRSSYARVSLRSPTATERVKRVRKRQPKEYDETRRCQGDHIQPIKNSRERNFLITKAVGRRRPIHSRTRGLMTLSIFKFLSWLQPLW